MPSRAVYSCPAYVNPPEYFMSVVQDEGAVERLAVACEVAKEQPLPDPTAPATTKGAAAGQLRHMATASSIGAASASSAQRGISGALGDREEPRCTTTTTTPIPTTTTSMGQLGGESTDPCEGQEGQQGVVEVWAAAAVSPGQGAEGEAEGLEAEGQEVLDREVAPVWLQVDATGPGGAG